MSWLPSDWARRLHLQQSPSDISLGLRVAGTALRVVFIACLIAITMRVSMPQNETIWTIYDTPADVVRLALGLAVCVWVVIQLFRMPKDAQAYRTWLFFGLAAVPFALICLYAIR